MKEFYLARLDENWSMIEIDEMDFFYYMDLLIYNANKAEKLKTAYIDDLW